MTVAEATRSLAECRQRVRELEERFERHRPLNEDQAIRLNVARLILRDLEECHAKWRRSRRQQVVGRLLLVVFTVLTAATCLATLLLSSSPRSLFGVICALAIFVLSARTLGMTLPGLAQDWRDAHYEERSILHPPGSGLMALVRLIVPRSLCTQSALSQSIADMQHEHFEALAAGDEAEARRIVWWWRGRLVLVALRMIPESMLQVLARAWKSVG